MRPTRRFILAGGASLFPGVLGKWQAIAAAHVPSNLVVCLTNVTPDTSAEQLQTVVDAFHSWEIPISCVIDVAEDTWSPSFFRAVALAQREPGLFELLVDTGRMTDRHRYFQMRRAGELRDGVRALLSAAQVDPMSTPVVSLFSRNDPDYLDFPAFRSAGFVSLLDLSEQTSQTTIARTNPEQIRLSGGLELDPAIPDEANTGRLEEALLTGGNLVLGVPMSGWTEGTGALYERVAEILGRELKRGALHGTLPADLAQHLSTKPPATLAVVLDNPNTADPDDPLHALMREFNESRIEFTILQPATVPDAAAEFQDQCTILETWGASDQTLTADCALVPAFVQLGDEAPMRSLIVDLPVGGWSGIDSRGHLAIPALRGRDRWGIWPDLSASTSDRLLFVSADDVPTHMDRIALTRRLKAISDADAAKIVSISQFTEHVTAPDPVFARFQAARKRRHLDPPQPAPLTETERSRLLEDARLAWRYFERMTTPRTGLCPGAVQIRGASVIATPQLTLWDLGSHIHGIAASKRLGLITKSEASERIRAALESLPKQVIDDLRLPPRFMQTDRVGIASRGFDFCDTGRFLIALKTTVEANLIAADEAQAVFDAWDVKGALREGRPFDQRNGRWHEAFYNHCMPYLKRGLAAWGLNMASPYPDEPREGTADYQMRLLYALAFIGPLGTEPPLLEATELGASPATDCMMNILFDAQISSFERTGILKCVSETPLHRQPWFSYQGLRVDAPLDASWVISAPGSDPKFETPEFQASIEAINSKAAYLWAARYPHPYTRELLTTIREKARIADLGFSPGVFAHSGEPMEGFSDVNTNGVILCAIAQILDAR